jgi:hypothetical protein
MQSIKASCISVGITVSTERAVAVAQIKITTTRWFACVIDAD